MKLKKRNEAIIVFLFVAILVLPLLTTSLSGNSTAVQENRVLSDLPVLIKDTGKLNNEFLPQLETWFNDHVGLREPLVKLHSAIHYNLFNRSAVDKVLIGHDGWLYYASENNLNVPSNGYPLLGENELRTICNRQIEISNKLAAKGIQYILILPPSKASIYPEFIPGIVPSSVTPVDILADYIEAHSDVKVIRLKQALLDKKAQSDDLLYYKTDTHWNDYGIYTAYEAIIEQLNKWGVTNTQPVSMTYSQSESMHDLSSMLFPDDSRFSETTTDYSIESPSAVKQESGDLNDWLQNYISDKKISQADYWLNSDPSLFSSVAFGDSMFLNHLESLIAEHCSSMVYVWSNDIDWSIVDTFKPNVVFYEITERYLSKLAGTNSEFVRTSIQLDNNILNISFCDFGEYPKMWFPTWSEENGQGEQIWYEANRTDDWHWSVSIDLTEHPLNGVCHTQFYRGHTNTSKKNRFSERVYRISDGQLTQSVS